MSHRESLFDQVWKDLGLNELSQEEFGEECKAIKELSIQHTAARSELMARREAALKELSDKYDCITKSQEDEYLAARNRFATFTQIEQKITELLQEYNELQVQKACQGEIQSIIQRVTESGILVSKVLSEQIMTSSEALSSAIEASVAKILNFYVVCQNAFYIFEGTDDRVCKLYKQLEAISETTKMQEEEPTQLTSFFPEKLMKPVHGQTDIDTFFPKFNPEVVVPPAVDIKGLAIPHQASAAEAEELINKWIGCGEAKEEKVLPCLSKQTREKLQELSVPIETLPAKP